MDAAQRFQRAGHAADSHQENPHPAEQGGWVPQGDICQGKRQHGQGACQRVDYRKLPALVALCQSQEIYRQADAADGEVDPHAMRERRRPDARQKDRDEAYCGDQQGDAQEDIPAAVLARQQIPAGMKEGGEQGEGSSQRRQEIIPGE